MLPDDSQEQYEFDYNFYNSMPWMIAKTIFSLSIISMTFVLYGLHEMPWTIWGSGTGMVILLVAPFFAGMIMGYSFENPKWDIISGDPVPPTSAMGTIVANVL